MNCANCVKCIVKPAAECWVAQIGGKEFGPYLSRDIALQVAVADAHARHKSKSEICVIVEDAQGVVRAQQCLCDRSDATQAAGA